MKQTNDKSFYQWVDSNVNTNLNSGNNTVAHNSGDYKRNKGAKGEDTGGHKGDREITMSVTTMTQTPHIDEMTVAMLDEEHDEMD